MQKMICIYCQLPFEVPAAVCSECGGPVDTRRAFGLDVPSNDDFVIELDESFDEASDEGFEILPLGADDATLFGSSVTVQVLRPPPLRSKRTVRM